MTELLAAVDEHAVEGQKKTVGSAGIPEVVAYEILSNANYYPLPLWDAAETVASSKARKAVRPVAKIAKLDKWFDD